jgi:hypothetical protein
MLRMFAAPFDIDIGLGTIRNTWLQGGAVGWTNESVNTTYRVVRCDGIGVKL